MTEPAPDFGPRLEKLGARFGLTEDQVEQLRRFGSLLVHDEFAPTTVRDPGRVRDDHLADALVALELPVVAEGGLIADLGAGAGVPGIPLAVALPEARISLVEGNGRKCEFMARAVGLLELGNTEVVHGRAETWGDGLGRLDVVTSRALAPLDVLAEYAAPLLRIGGALVAWRGVREPQLEADGARAAAILGLSVAEPVRVEPYKGAENRYLHVMWKREETPSRFPRRDGVARKRPLGRA
ncbi:MAG TPA: 16S rRNA (guanine(527)-N(7))-methyltransferase RsmG [Solirubrobacteraceae bacterium]|jgi:16S rRNA (guanine527-N7)-methyltransferase|nr:16S rRNA (guanine(527)-N(7))-methyltransferase RsmG [Solirubrobacteraceae bacterium]